MYFSTLDLASGFHRIEMDPKHRERTAFNVEGRHYKYLRMLFGLENTPSTFQRVMDNVLQNLMDDICLVYLDGIIVYFSSLQEHLVNLNKVFPRLQRSNLKVNIAKTSFLNKECCLLGHIVSENGIKPNSEKVRAVQNFTIPKTAKEIKSFLGPLGYY